MSQVLSSHVWLVDSTDVELFHQHRNFYQIALLIKDSAEPGISGQSTREKLETKDVQRGGYNER